MLVPDCLQVALPQSLARRLEVLALALVLALVLVSVLEKGLELDLQLELEKELVLASASVLKQ